MTSFAEEITQLNELKRRLSRKIRYTYEYHDQLFLDNIEYINKEIKVSEERLRAYPEYEFLGEEGMVILSPPCVTTNLVVVERLREYDLISHCDLTSVTDMLCSVSMPLEIRPTSISMRNHLGHLYSKEVNDTEILSKYKEINETIFDKIIALDKAKSELILDLASKLKATRRTDLDEPHLA